MATTPAGFEALRKDLRRVILTGVGAAVLAKEGAYDLAQKLLEKGETVEPDLRKAFKKLSERRRSVGRRADGLRTSIDGSFKKFVAALPLVTRKDVSVLAGRIDTLSAKLDALAARKR